MPITAHRTVSSVTKPSGAIDAVFEYDWHTGESSRQKWRLAVGTDVDAFRTARVPKVEVSQRNSEIERQVSLARKGVNPDKVPVHQEGATVDDQQVNFDRRLIAALMQETSVDTLIAALPFWTAQEGRNGTNNNARADKLGVPRPEYIQAAARFGDLQGVAGGVTTVNEQVWDGLPSGAWS
jgi:hypothetical protein